MRVSGMGAMMGGTAPAGPVLLAYDTQELNQFMSRNDTSDLERIYVWQGDARILLALAETDGDIDAAIEYLKQKGVAKAAGKACKSYRSWMFALCFVSIGLETDFKELVSVGGGRPAIAYWLSQAANAVWTLFIVWILWSGTFFTPAILPD